MKRILLPFLTIILCITCKDNPSATLSTSAARIVKSGLNYPWEIIWGKDNHIWMTERDGKISRIDPANGNVTFSFTVPDAESNNEGGLLGMALHPGFAQNGFLYVVYDYRSNGNYKEKLVRYHFSNNTLNSPFILLDGIEGSSNHDGSRLWITNETNPKIFMSTGDALNQSLPQNTNSKNGKLLRLNLDGTIPSDNPFPNNPVWSYGHRNPQGLVMANNILYASEHGPDIEDELNIIEKGRNYGWPEVNGPCNGSEANFCTTKNIKEPIWSSGNNTIAVCGLDYYHYDLIPQWKNSLLMMTLKNSSVRQMKLSDDGRTIIQTQTFFKDQWGRLRDLCISPAGKVYICTSNGGNNDVIVEISKL
ncbi:MAG TPA: PQQ-dependent sugar dehydrogenase [Chitinophagaceae bacterium]|jgi:glucose/arabinose dehydrogenase|nr:PQQ-dependent sugar dehydrogenase [Chitinophagaceae bacterium]